MLAVLNVAFFAFHGALVLFNVVGWAWTRTRRWNLATLLLTPSSWIVMGLRFGAGYCVLTDLHWRVRSAMGIHESDPSYLSLVVRLLTGWSPPVGLVNLVAGIAFLAALTTSVFLNGRDVFLKKSSEVQPFGLSARPNHDPREDER